MNDRYIKLALDAGLLNYVDHETPRSYFINGNAEQEDVEKFAELIVQECLNIVNRHEYSYHEADPLWETAQLIKQHFGVEE
jgi:hypothetical protein